MDLSLLVSFFWVNYPYFLLYHGTITRCSLVLCHPCWWASKSVKESEKPLSLNTCLLLAEVHRLFVCATAFKNLHHFSSIFSSPFFVLFQCPYLEIRQIHEALERWFIAFFAKHLLLTKHILLKLWRSLMLSHFAVHCLFYKRKLVSSSLKFFQSRLFIALITFVLILSQWFKHIGYFLSVLSFIDKYQAVIYLGSAFQFNTNIFSLEEATVVSKKLLFNHFLCMGVKEE